jgi:hypothetical protein
MRTSPLAAAALALAALATPEEARAWVAVRAPVYHPHAVVVVAPAPVYVAPAPVYVAPAPVYVAPAPAPPPAPVLTEKLPVNTTMWTLPSGCTPVSSSGGNFFVCGPNWLKAIPSEKGTYYAVVAPP